MSLTRSVAVRFGERPRNRLWPALVPLTVAAAFPAHAPVAAAMHLIRIASFAPRTSRTEEIRTSERG